LNISQKPPYKKNLGLNGFMGEFFLIVREEIVLILCKIFQKHLIRILPNSFSETVLPRQRHYKKTTDQYPSEIEIEILNKILSKEISNL